MENPTARTSKTPAFCTSRVCCKHVIPRWSHDSWHEHGSAVYESAWQSNARPSGEQQFLLHKHKHRSWWLWVVCHAWLLLGWHSSAVREKQHQLFAWILVAGVRGPVRRQYPSLQVYTTSWRPCLGECGVI